MPQPALLTRCLDRAPHLKFLRGMGVPLAAELKTVVSIPVISVRRINDLRLAAKIIREGNAGLVAMGRALPADPDLPVKSLKGRYSEILKCSACKPGMRRG